MQISYPDAAAAVLRCVGGANNIVSNTLCMTRLRLTVANPTLIDTDQLTSIPGVLGTAGRGPRGIEVVFGPKLIGPVYEAFCRLSGLSETSDDLRPASGVASPPIKIHIATKRRARPDTSDDESEISDLSRLLSSVSEKALTLATEDEEEDEDALELDIDLDDAAGLRLLVINGPNINMLGIREPGLYGSQDFVALLELCQKTAKEQGFSECHCYQSNHEGDLVDAIQDAYQVYDGIIINPGAYTHTSVAILDALMAVSIPAIEVHISQVSEREDFRQVSYVRQACLKTIMGEGIEGYAHAIRDMAAHLDA